VIHPAVASNFNSDRDIAVFEASKLSDDKLGEFLRREGLHEAQLEEWRKAAVMSLADAPRSKARSKEAKKIKELERELRRKDKALAEASALLILKKEVEAIWGDVDDDTSEENES
jgi:transposase